MDQNETLKTMVSTHIEIAETFAATLLNVHQQPSKILFHNNFLLKENNSFNSIPSPIPNNQQLEHLLYSALSPEETFKSVSPFQNINDSNLKRLIASQLVQGEVDDCSVLICTAEIDIDAATP